MENVTVNKLDEIALKLLQCPSQRITDWIYTFN